MALHSTVLDGVDFRTELVAAKSLSVKRLCAALGRKIIERRRSLHHQLESLLSFSVLSCYNLRVGSRENRDWRLPEASLLPFERLLISYRRATCRTSVHKCRDVCDARVAGHL